MLSRLGTSSFSSSEVFVRVVLCGSVRNKVVLINTSTWTKIYNSYVLMAHFLESIRPVRGAVHQARV